MLLNLPTLTELFPRRTPLLLLEKEELIVVATNSLVAYSLLSSNQLKLLLSIVYPV
ncbi:hypothetical protein WN943_006311 [Citrus x changshan-huyou]